MSRLGAKTYSRKPDCRTSIQFDHLLAEKGNKPSTAKVSVAGIHRWGMTSFTSLRKSRLNGQKEPSVEPIENVKRVKIDSPPVACTIEDPFSFESDIIIPHPKTTEEQPAKPRVNKFFKSGSRANRNLESKNNDFDALRLSVPANFKNNNDSHHVQSRLLNVGGPVEDPHSMFVAPNIVDLRLSSHIPKSCSSIASSPQPSIHYISPPLQSKSMDSASHAFDALFGTKLSNNSVKEDLPMESYSTEIHLGSSQKENEPCEKDLNMCETTYSGTLTEHNFTNRAKAEVIPLCDFKPPQEVSELLKLDTDSHSVSLANVSSSSGVENSQSMNGSKPTSRPKKIFSSSLKAKAKYNHRHWQSPNKTELDAEQNVNFSLAEEFEEETLEDQFADDIVAEVANTSVGDIRSYKCPKGSKEFYTVVKNVKQAYQCHESGETQEFNDDIEYLLECVQETNAIGTRCLSVLNLAAKCMGPAFRIHLRAHGTMPKIFSALKDAPQDPNLALCTATLMFVLSQDRLTMDIEASTLSLMLQLLETDPEMRNPDKEIDLILKDPALCAMQDKHREKVNQLCEEMQQKGHAKHLKLDNLNTGILAMETLLSLTSRKAGEWFKEEMRTLRGLDRIADTVTSSIEILLPEEREIIQHPTEVHLDKIRKIDRCLRVLENVTNMNSENQEYLMNYKNSSLILSSVSLLRVCKSYLLEQTPVEYDLISDESSSQKTSRHDSPLLSCILNLLKILSNITYRIALDDSQFSSGDGLMDHVLLLILQVPRAVPIEKRFDLLVLSLGLMINLVEYSFSNSTKFIEMYGLGSFDTVNDGYEMPAAEALTELMLSRLEAARVSEEQADELLNSQEENQAQLIAKKDVETAADDLEETLMKTLQKAGKHMEHSIVAAYIVILLGCVAQKNTDFISIMKDYVPDGKFDVMVEVLKKFQSFVSLTGSIGNRELAAIQKVIQLLETS